MKGFKNLFHTLKAKISATLIAVSLIVVLITGISSIIISRGILSELMETSRIQIANQATKGVDNYFLAMSKMVQVMAEDDNIKSSENIDLFEHGKDLMSNVKNTDANIINVFMGTEEGMFYLDPAADLDADFDHRTREWYIEAKEDTSNVNISSPYVDVASGSIVITLSKGIVKDDKFIGVVGIDLQLDALSKEISGINNRDYGYIFITDSSGIVVTHPDEKQIGSDYITTLPFWQEAKGLISGQTDYNFDGVDRYVTYTSSKVTGWKIFASTEKTELTDRTDKIIVSVGFTVVLAIAISIIVAVLFSAPIAKNIEKVLRGFSRFSGGDMTVRIDIESRDEFETIGTHFNEMASSITGVISKVSDSSKIVLHNAGILTKMADETNSSVNEVARAIEEIANGTSEQAANASDGASSINDLANELTMIVTATEEMNQSSRAADIRAREGLNFVQNLSNNSENTMDSTTKVSALVFETSESVYQIHQISNTIDSITEQTNLLALNASIEAARAGESGRGFGVVANEIRKLADQSKNSTLQIKEIIEQIIKKTEHSVIAMEETKKNVTDQVELVNQTKSVFQEIMESIDILAKQVSKVKNNTERISAKKEEVVYQIENISAISEEAASATEEVTASTEEISVTMDEITKHTAKLSMLSKELQNSVDTFKLK